MCVCVVGSVCGWGGGVILALPLPMMINQHELSDVVMFDWSTITGVTHMHTHMHTCKDSVAMFFFLTFNLVSKQDFWCLNVDSSSLTAFPHAGGGGCLCRPF